MLFCIDMIYIPQETWATNVYAARHSRKLVSVVMCQHFMQFLSALTDELLDVLLVAGNLFFVHINFQQP